MHILRSHFFRFLAIATAAGTLQQATAQNATSALEAHPAVKVVKEYNNSILSEAWEKASQLIETASLETLRDDYVDNAKRPGIMSLDDEKTLLEKFAVKDLEDIKKVNPRKFYATYHNLVKEKKKIPADLITKVKDSMKLSILGVVEEKELGKVHVLVRSRHENGRAMVENMELVSLVNEGGKWVVGLNEQTAKVTQLPTSQMSPEAKAEALKRAAAKPPGAPK